MIDSVSPPVSVCVDITQRDPSGMRERAFCSIEYLSFWSVSLIRWLSAWVVATTSLEGSALVGSFFSQALKEAAQITAAITEFRNQFHIETGKDESIKEDEWHPVEFSVL